MASSTDRTKPRRRWFGSVQIAIVAALVLFALLYARSPDRDSANGPPSFAAGRVETPPPLVRVIQPAAERAALRIAATGSVGVRNHVALALLVGGRVVSVSPSLRAGGAFRAGERLLMIEPRDFELAYDQATAEVATAAASLMLQEAEGDAAEANYTLLNPGQEVPPLIAKTPQIARAEAQLAAAQARLDVAALELERTSFSLPFDGRITASSAEVGDVLSRSQSFGQAFALDAVEIATPLPLADVKRLQPIGGRRALVRAEERTLTARVERMSAELDARSRFATLYLTFVDEAEPPLPGTFVNLEIEGPELADAYVLPEAAEQVGGTVWLVAGDRLQSFAPRVFGRTAEGWVVAAFNALDGVVLGAVPGARVGLRVQASGAVAGG